MELRSLGKTGLNVSVMSQGGAAIGQQYGPVSVSDVAATVHAAIDAGVNLIDTAAYYGMGASETILGEVLQGGWREKVSICTKACRLDKAVFDFSPEGTRKSCEESLKRLRTDRVEILIAHDIEFATDYDYVFDVTVPALHQLKKEGKARFVGVSGLPLGVLKLAIERCELDVVISYAHFNLQNQQLLTDLLPLAEQHGVGVLNASPLSLGLLTNQGPQSWHPASDYIKLACKKAAELCQSRGADIAFLGMQYCFAETRIPSTITGTARKEELAVNLRAMSEPIDTELLADVLKILESVKDKMWASGNWPG